MTTGKNRIYIDVDGVLNFDKKTQYSFDFKVPWDGFSLHIRMDSRHGKWLLDLAEETNSELWWATTWMDSANTDIGPKIGLPKLPVIYFGDRGFSQSSASWKGNGVGKDHNDIPFVWFDDDFDIPLVLRHWKMPKHTVRLVHGPSGLTEADIDFARKWLLDL